MTILNIYDAKTNFSALVASAQQGEETIIAKAGKPVAKLVPYTQKKSKRTWGFLKGKIKMAPDFDTTPKEIIDSFYENGIEPAA